MAGIGFELRKVFSKKGLYNKVRGVVFATMTTIGPTIIFLCMLLTVTFVLQLFRATEAEQIFFSSACMYVFLICILISGGMGTILSRFISDRLHEREEEYIPSAMLGSTFAVTMATAVFVGILCILLYVFDHVDLPFLIGLYMLGISVSVAYNNMVFVSALKEYGKITFAFFCGLLSGGVMFVALYLGGGAPLLLATLCAMITIFLVIDVIIIYYVTTYFPKSNQAYFAFTKYFKKHPCLFLSGFLYMLGMFTPNVLYWFFSDIGVSVGILRVAPSYDMAMFLAILVNLTAPVIFVVDVETKFFEKYRTYTASLLNGTYDSIEKHRKIMLRVMDVELFYIYEVQLIITVILICLGILVLPMLGFGGLILNFFLILGIGAYTVYLMYFTVVFLYYFDDQIGSVLTTGVFLGTTTIASLVAIKLGISFYSTALLAGGMVSWAVGFFRLKYFMKGINARLFCREET